MLGNKMGWVLSFSVALGSALILAPGAGAATHYPPGSACYDCHAVSKAKMIVGTRLIKKSQKTIDLGMGTGDTAIRCLFCHETGAVSVGARTTMLGVWEHFQPTSRSKHPVVEDSTFSEGTTNRFDCMDCHTGISAGVVSDGAGNATVHGSDASTAPHVDPYPTLVGAPANAGQLSANTCQNAVCHDADGGGVGNYDAPPLHAFVTTTINDGAAPTECTDCHGTHNSYQGDALVVLRSDGTTSNDPAEPLSTLVTPEKCGECHSADDGAAASDFVARGHGRSDLTGGALTCTNCHDATIPHGFSRDAVTQGTDLSNPMRFASASYDETTELKSGLSGKASEGMCMLCHNTYAGLIHNGGGMNVSCQDCHEAHGKGMGANTRMVREQIPLLGGATDTMIFTGVVADDYWDQDFTNGQHPVNNSSYGVCDNMDCHGSLPESPIATFVAAAGSHTGGEVTVGSACGGCHSHDSANGTWAAGATACSNCHGYPPATNAHQTHVSDAGFGCENCHPGPGVTNHNETGVRDATDFNTQWNVVRDNLDVGFAQSPAYTTGTYSLAKGVSRPDDAVTYGTCTTDCHGGALDAANQGTRLIPQWSRTDTLLGAGNGDGACGTCHDVARDGDPANTPDSGNHLYHTATSASNLGFGCQSCHSTTTQNGTSIVTGGGTHVDGAQSLAGGGVFSTVNVSFGFADPTCSAITCHGSYSSVAWGASVGNCANCHGSLDGTYDLTGGMVGVVAAHKEADWTNNLGGDNLRNFGDNHRGTATGVGNREEYCDWCHNNTQGLPAYDPAKVANATAQGNHLDGIVQINLETGYQGTTATSEAAAGCATACHPAITPYQMAESNLPLDKTEAGQLFACGACHNNGTVPPTSGAHAIHLTAARGGVWSDTGDYSACEACHGTNGGAGFTIVNGGSADADTHGNGSTTFSAAVTYANPDTIPANADDSCLTTNCHSPNNSVALPGTSPNPASWVDATAATIGCDECHYWAATPSSAANADDFNAVGGSHGAHFAGSWACTECHPDNAADLGGTGVRRTHINDSTGANDGAVLIGRAVAVQDEAEVSAAALGTLAAVDPGNEICDNIACHSPSGDGHGSNPWGTASVGCEMCHNTATAPDTTVAAAPAGSHGAHVTTMGYACTACHDDNAADEAHLNQTIELTNSAAGTITYNPATAADDYPGGFGSCAVGSCHVGPLAWGGTATDCAECHLGTGDINNFSGNDETASRIDSAEYAAAGHGALLGGAPESDAVACLDCHDMGAPHDASVGLSGATGNPFRLLDQTTLGGAQFFSCSFDDGRISPNGACHDTGRTTSVYSLDYQNVVTHTAGAMTAAGYTPKYAWSIAPECVNCHDPHGDATNLSMIQKELYGEETGAFALPGTPAVSPPSAPTEQTNLVFTDNTTGQQAAVGTYADTTAFSSVCQECHVSNTIGFVDDTSASQVGHPGGTGNPGDCAACHKHDTAFKPSGCSGCHGGGTAGTDADNYWPDGVAARPENDAGRHATHLDRLAARVYGETLGQLLTNNTAQTPGVASDTKQQELCSYCHDTPGADADHAQTLPAEVSAMYTLWSKTLDDGVYSAAADTCATTDCHANRLTTDNVYGWYDATAGACVMCHDTAPNTNAHLAHTGSNALPPAGQDDCFACHATTIDTAQVPDVPFAQSPTAQHIDGTADLVFDAGYDYEAASAARAAGTGATSTCSNVLCHNGVTTPQWNVGVINCGQCHNTGAAGPLPSAASVSGSHANHANNDADATECGYCHLGAATYTATGGTNHQNLTVDLGGPNMGTYVDNVAVANDAGGVNWIPGGTDHVDNGTCSTTTCHGAGAPVWGGTLPTACFECHPNTGEPAGGVKPVETADSAPNAIDQAQYTSAGHGQAGAFPGSGTTGPGYTATSAGCNNCHAAGAQHAPTKSATDPYRLGANATTTNALCDACHGVGGGATVVDIVSHTQAITGSTKTWPQTYDYKCVDCHDPHGDANYYMVRSHLSAPTTAGDASFGSNQYGTPADTGNLSAVTFTDLTGNLSNSYGVPGAGNGLCEVCHVDATHTHYSRDDAAAQTHNVAARCTTCHTHPDGFQASCYDCHGGGLAAEGNRNWWPDSEVAVNGTAYPNRLASHTAHVTRIAEVVNATATPTTVQKNATCDWCHPNPGDPRTGKTGETGHDDNGSWTAPADLFQDGVVAGETQYFKDILGDVDAGSATATVNWKDASTVYCSNADCHYEGAEGSPNGSAAFGSPNWYGGSVSCNSCHPEWTFFAGYNPGDLPNVHDVHTDDGAYGFNCFACHPAAFSMAHQNGVVGFNYDDGRIGGGVVDLDGTLTIGDGDVKYGGGGSYTTCSNLYCHGDIPGGNNPTPAWNGTAACGTCHGDTLGADDIAKSYPRTVGYAETHLEHLNSNTGPGCSACHEGTGTVGLGTYGAYTNHVKGGTLNVIFGSALNETEPVNYEARSATYNGTVRDGADVGDTCANVRCHNGATTPSFQDGTTAACGTCHSETWNVATGTGPLPTGGASVAGSHANHANNDADYTECGYCHAGAALYTATGDGGAGTHQNFAVTLGGPNMGAYADNVAVANDAGGVNWIAGGTDHVDNGTCSTTTCHGGGTPAWGGTLSTACFECHPNTGEPAGGIKPVETADSAPNAIDQAQYTSAGHGQGGSFPGSTTAGPGYTATSGGCNNCHSAGAQHAPTKSATDPYRLGANAANTNALCAICHSTLNIASHTRAVTGSSKIWPGDYDWKCVDCHDPHGDANYYMVRSHLSAPLNAVDASIGSNPYGTPADTGNLAAVTFTDLTGEAANSYVVAGGNGMCEVCHNQTTYFNRGDGGTQSHNNATRCSDCHDHGQGFQGSCTSCHGDEVSGQIWPDNVANNSTRVAYADNDVGSHDNHVMAVGQVLGYGDYTVTMYSGGQQTSICAYCHPGPGGGGHDADGGADQRVDVAGAGVFLKHDGAGASATDTTSLAYSQANLNCSNLVCHNQVATPTGANNWNTPPAADCTTLCHPAVAQTQRHDTHVVTQGYACTECHVDNGTTAFGHGDGAVNLVWSNVGSFEQTYGGGTVTYSQVALLVYKDATWGTCATAACHNDKTSPAWNAAVTGSCLVCHTEGGADANPATGLHAVTPTVSGVVHDDTLGSGCTGCHTSLGASHRNGTFVADGAANTDRGLFADYTDGAANTGSCSGAPGAVGAAGCHDGIGEAGTWARLWSDTADDGGTTVCDNCHGVFGGWTFGGGAHADTDGNVEHEYNWDTDGSNNEVQPNHSTCKQCHGMNDSGDASANYTVGASFWNAVDGTSMHGDGQIQMNGPTGTGVGYNQGNWGCDDAAACHGDATTNHRLENSNWTVGFGDFGGASCTNCHSYPPTSGDGTTSFTAVNAIVDHLSRTRTDVAGTSGDAGFLSAHAECTTCHGVSGNGTLDDFANAEPGGSGRDAYVPGTHHNDGSIQLNGISLNPSNDNQNADYQVANGGCGAACHAIDWRLEDSLSYSTTNIVLTQEYGSGDCFGCHGNGVDEYWPDGVGGNPEDDAGRHLIHMQEIAARIGFTLPGTDAQQKQACEYCHAAATNDDDHGVAANLPAEVFVTNIATVSTSFAKHINGVNDANAAYTAYTAGGGAFDGSCATTDCHNNQTTDVTTAGNTTGFGWYDAGTSTCTMCHTAGGTGWDPVSGLHSNTVGSVRNHDDTLGGASGCQSCHASAAAPPSTHIDGTWEADLASNTQSRFIDRASMTYTEAAPNSATCSAPAPATGLDTPGCHSDGGEWTRKWSTDADVNIVTSPAAGQAVCNVCHGQYSSLPNSTGWNVGTVHFRGGSGAIEDKGSIHLGTPAGDECEDCHGYDSAAVHNSNNAIDFTDLSGGYTATRLTGPDRWYCAACHTAQAAEDPTLTTTHTYPDSLAFPNSKNSVTGTSTPEGSCFGCHGGGTAGVSQSSYWPDSGVKIADAGASADDEGAHVKHVEALASAAYGETATGAADNDILRDSTTANPGVTSDTKQRAICGYCHPSPGSDSDHMSGDDAEVPLNNGDYAWSGTFLDLSGASDANGDFGAYTTVGATCATIDCHNNAPSSPSWYSGASLACSDCHSGITTHIDYNGAAAGGGACEDCHPGGATYTAKHSDNASANIVTIPLPPANWTDPSGRMTGTNMQTQLGIDYAFGGIHLGGEQTNGTTEAEICWNCHDGLATPVSEWGYNTKTTPTGLPVVQLSTTNDGTAETFNFGWIYQSATISDANKTSNWVAGGTDGNPRPVWLSQYESSLRFRIVSAHSVNFDPAKQVSSVAGGLDGSSNINFTGTTMELAADIRCSYCHDVHNTKAGSPNGAPYLRGVWLGNPYPPDLPPMGSTSYSGNKIPSNNVNGKPRALAAHAQSRAKGGFFIDVNSGEPTDNTARDTYSEVAGLCELCHGSTVNTMDFYTGSKLWRSVSTNGHANSTVGGTGASAADLFDPLRGGSGADSGTMAQMECAGQQKPGVNCWGWGDPLPTNDDQPLYSPLGGGQPEATIASLSNWGWAGGATNWFNGTAVSSYNANSRDTYNKPHSFTCSKCHSPHASGMPALLITNCLDQEVSTWSIYSNTIGPATAASYTEGPGNQTANNCHKKEDPAHTASPDGSGWHRIAPGQGW